MIRKSTAVRAGERNENVMRREITTLRLAASHKAETNAFLLVPAGSLSRIRTYGRSINSRELYR
jgi:hypothetical protein